MIQELKTYYYANGISAFGFRCHFANSCRLFCNNFGRCCMKAVLGS